MSLDINTPKGQESLKQEIEMLKYISKCWDVKIKTTPKNGSSPYDGVMLKNEKIIGIFESKNRNIEIDQYDTWLITYNKLEECKNIAKKMNVPFYGFLGLELSNVVACFKITNSNGEYLFDFEHKVTPTQATVNGGEALRDNAYLPFKYCVYVQPNNEIP